MGFPIVLVISADRSDTCCRVFQTVNVRTAGQTARQGRVHNVQGSIFQAEGRVRSVSEAGEHLRKTFHNFSKIPNPFTKNVMLRARVQML